MQIILYDNSLPEFLTFVLLFAGIVLICYLIYTLYLFNENQKKLLEQQMVINNILKDVNDVSHDIQIAKDSFKLGGLKIFTSLIGLFVNKNKQLLKGGEIDE